MSSILKALRRLEEEKAANREGGLDIGRDILRGSVGRRPQRNWFFPAAILAFLLLLGWGGYLLLVPSAAIPVAAPAAGPPLPVTVAPSRPPDLRPRTVVAEPPVVEETIMNREPASFSSSPTTRPVAAAKPPPVPAPVAASATAHPVATTPPSSPAQIAPPAPAPPVSVPAPPQPSPALLLTAIAYNELPDARLAVINDLPVMIGTDVDGAVVEDILQDRVRLKQNGKSFEIRLSQ